MLYCPNFFWNVLQVWMTGKDVYLQMTWSWPDKTWHFLCSYCLQWNTSQSKFRNHYFLFLFAFSILSQLFLIWGCILSDENYSKHSYSIVLHLWATWRCFVPERIIRLNDSIQSQWLTNSDLLPPSDGFNFTFKVPFIFVYNFKYQYSTFHV